MLLLFIVVIVSASFLLVNINCFYRFELCLIWLMLPNLPSPHQHQNVSDHSFSFWISILLISLICRYIELEYTMLEVGMISADEDKSHSLTDQHLING